MNNDESLSRYDRVILALYKRLVEQHSRDLTEYPFDKEFLDQLAAELRIKIYPTSFILIVLVAVLSRAKC